MLCQKGESQRKMIGNSLLLPRRICVVQLLGDIARGELAGVSGERVSFNSVEIINNGRATAKVG